MQSEGEINPKELKEGEVFTKLLNSDIIAEKEEEANKLLQEGTNEEILDFICETFLLARKVQKIAYKCVLMDTGVDCNFSEVYHPKHFK